VAEEVFWLWFVANEPRLFNYRSDQEKLFDELAEQMHQVHPDLTFEFGPGANGRKQFVISAGGVRAAFAAVESLRRAAPALDRWEVVAFRPRNNPLNSITFGGVTVSPEDVSYRLSRRDNKLDIEVFIVGFDASRLAIFKQLGYLFLDQSLGEHDVETYLGYIEFFPSSNPSAKTGRSIRELAKEFDALVPTLSR
jgi:hypothetical protein